MNTAYKHLDTKLRIAELSLVQWAGILLGLGVAIVWGFYLSPLGTKLTLGSSVYLGAVPGGMVVLSTFYEIDLGLLLRSALGWRRLDGRFTPGPGRDLNGYVVAAPAEDRDASITPSTIDLGALWES